MISAFERDNFLWDAQAGFRPEQEFVGQVGALIEIIQRWITETKEGKSTKTGWRRIEGVCVVH